MDEPIENSLPPAQSQTTGLIIVGALTGGMVLFTAVVAFLVTSGTMGDGSGGLGLPAVPVAAGLAVAALTAPFVLRPLLAAKVASRAHAALDEVENGLIPNELLTATIVAGAVAEGPGLLGATLGLLESDLTYLVAPGAAALALVLLLPTRKRLARMLGR